MGTMATSSPFSLLQGIFQGARLPDFQPPGWVVDEGRRRVVLLLNHIVSQEGEAMARLARQQGRIVHLKWRSFSMSLVATPAGLLDLAAQGATPDLVLEVTQASAWELAQTALRGDRPAVQIEGDVQWAAEVNWLVDHVRWDLEEDLARVLGDAPAHALVQAARQVATTLREFIGAGSSTDAVKALV